MRLGRFFLILFFPFFTSHAQVDNVGSGYALSFDGIDDYIDLGNIYDDLTLPVTVSAWIYLDPSVSGVVPIFHSQDNQPIYNGIIFVLHPTYLAIAYGDGGGENSSTFRRSKGAFFPSPIAGRWVHVTGIMRGPTDMDLYLNGINLFGGYSGDSNLPMASNFPSDVAKIGKVYNNGLISFFKGKMDEVRIWNRALTEAEIRQQMCRKLTGSENGLIGYWNFDETTGNLLADGSNNGFNGTLINNPTHVYSGAPIGDESIYQYSGNWSGVEVLINHNNDQLKVSNINGLPEGIQLYSVKTLPSQTQGLNLVTSTPPYFGVFAASTDVNNSFDMTYISNGISSCEVFTRIDNSVANWNSRLEPVKNAVDRVEIIKGAQQAEELNVNLGKDLILCPFTPRLLQPLGDPTGATFKWQDGSTQSTFNATDFGTYFVKVQKGCSVDQDTIIFSKSPPQAMEINLGEDFALCPFTPRLLQPISDPTGTTFKWQDGSTQPTFSATNFGTYYVTVIKECSIGQDTIVFSKDLNQTMQIDLGEDAIVCPFVPKVLSPLADPTGYEFTWHDGSKQSTFEITDYGKYWVTVKNECVTASDTIEISKLEAFDYFIPNVFTPNGDGYNENFIIDQRLIGSRLVIIDRWGKSIFSSDYYVNNWNGAGVPSGVYYYYIESKCTLPKKGWLSILK